MSIVSLEESADVFMKSIQQANLAPATIRNYHQKIHALLVFCRGHAVEKYSYETAELFSVFLKKRVDNGEIGDKYAGFLKGLALAFADFMIAGADVYAFVPHRTFISSCNTLNSTSRQTFADFSEYIKIRYAESSIRRYLTVAAQFLHYLEDHSLAVSVVMPQTIRDYIVFISPKRSGSIDTVMDSIRVFLRFLSEQSIISWPVERMSFHTPPHRKKVPVSYSPEEINRILSVINRDTSVGKRDYAIIILALYTGFRSVDIRLLKVTDIDWKSDTIHIIQHKTSRELSTPLLPIIGNAIAEYILHGRPAGNEPYVFLSHGRNSYAKAMGTGTIINRMRIYLQISGVKTHGGDGKDFHAIRKTFATNLLLSGTPLESVAAALGDAGVQASKPYLALDDKNLRQCCPNEMKYPCRKEGLYA